MFVYTGLGSSVVYPTIRANETGAFIGGAEDDVRTKVKSSSAEARILLYALL